MTFAQIYAAVRDQGGFDSGSTGSTLADVKAWVNEAYRKLVVRSRWRKAQVEIAVTVADQAEYAVADTVFDIVEGLLVGGTVYEQVGQETLWRLKTGAATVDRPVWAADYTAAGAQQVELYPAPDTAGVSIQALAALGPVDLAADGDVPIIPSDFHDAIVDAAIATGLRRLESRYDEATAYETRVFGDPRDPNAGGELEKLRRRANVRLSTGPVEIQVAGYHF